MFRSISKVNVRMRIVLASLVVTGVYLVFSTPILSWVRDVVLPPPEVENLQVIEGIEEVRLNWDKPDLIDLKSYTLIDGDERIEIGLDKTSYLYKYEERPESLIFVVRDRFNGSARTEFSLSSDSESILNSYVLNSHSETSRFDSYIVFRSFVIAVLLLISTLVVFNFDTSHIKSRVLAFYPSAVMLPYSLLTLSFLLSERAELNKFVLSLVFSIIMYVLCYFVILTTNILNTSIKVKIPLEQAARASQFIFSLVSSYLILILFFGVNYSFFEKIILIVPAIFYLSFSAILMLEGMTYNRAIIRSLSVTFTIVYAIFVLSIWPINYVYAILTIAVIFYILLNISLETRPKLGSYVWLEFFGLMALIAFLLVINSYWGINGTLI